MKQQLAIAAAGLALAFAAVPAAAATTVVLDFDELTGTGVMPATYGDVIFGDDFSYYDTPGRDYPPASGKTTIYANYAKYTPGVNSIQTFKFDELVRFDGAFFSGQQPVAFSLYRDGVQVASLSTFTLSTREARYYATNFTGLVDEVRIAGKTGTWVMDNLTYTTGVVPEPATWALMILGFGTAGAALRRRRFAAA